MGRIKKGILGGFSGKVGAVVGASWRGVDYMRGLPKLSTKPATTAQLAQQNKMGLVWGFLSGVQDLINDRFQNFKKSTPMNDVISYSLLHTIVGAYPEQQIDLPKFLFSKGELMGCWRPEVDSVESGAIEFSWTNGNFMLLRAADDLVTVVVYDPIEKKLCILKDAAKRKAARVKILLPPTFSKHKVHCYISFYSKNRKLASTSEYIGQVVVA